MQEEIAIPWDVLLASLNFHMTIEVNTLSDTSDGRLILELVSSTSTPNTLGFLVFYEVVAYKMSSLFPDVKVVPWPMSPNDGPPVATWKVLHSHWLSQIGPSHLQKTTSHYAIASGYRLYEIAAGYGQMETTS
jgi:hypothetical protein